MRIGIDFDNTIACYDGVFHEAAVQQGLVPADIDTTKNAVRDYLKQIARERDFTELQGYVYGARMDLVRLYPGLMDFVASASAAGLKVFIISHKTRYPLEGARYDLHASAFRFLEANHLIGPAAVAPANVFFEETKEAKVARTAALALDVFIDDLPEILHMPGFPSGIRKILFDPYAYHLNEAAFERYSDWTSIAAKVLP